MKQIASINKSKFKIINGKRYYIVTMFTIQKQAEKYADDLRKQGMSIRLRKSGKYYVIWGN
jgi:hypothetical protein